MEYSIHYRKKDKGIQFIISYKDNNKWRQKSKQGFKSKKEAKVAADKLLEELRNDLNQKTLIDPEYKDITFKQFVDEYIAHEKLYREANTIRNLNNSVKKFKDLHDLPMNKIEAMDVQKCIDQLVKENLKESTIKNHLINLKAFFNSAIKQYKILSSSPCENIKISLGKGESIKKALTKSEFNELVKRLVGTKYHIIVLLAGSCGLRIGEIMGLTWADIDFKNSTLSVNKQWKSLDYMKYGFGYLKSKNSNRIVPIPPSTLKELKKYQCSYPINFDNRLVKNTDPTVLGVCLNRRIKKEGFNITVHELRHTYATVLIANGVDFKTVAKLLGHDVEMTMRIYSHVNDDMMLNATKTINNIF